MKLVLLAGKTPALGEIAGCVNADARLDLSFAGNGKELSRYGEILVLTELFCGVPNSALISLFEACSDQNILEGKLINFVCVSSEASNFAPAKEAILKFSLALKFSVGMVQNFICPKNGANLSADFAARLNNLVSILNGGGRQNLASNEVTIYTDGACSGNPGAGGWGAVLLHGASKKEISGYEPETTNNRMELTAVIEALKMLKAPCRVELYSDSAYVVNAIANDWLSSWKNNGWIGSDKRQIKNIELWRELSDLMEVHEVHFNKVKGHSTDELNNRCDALATGEIAAHSGSAQ